MSTDDRYNCWSNHETWRLNLWRRLNPWLTNDEETDGEEIENMSQTTTRTTNTMTPQAPYSQEDIDYFRKTARDMIGRMNYLENLGVSTLTRAEELEYDFLCEALRYVALEIRAVFVG